MRGAHVRFQPWDGEPSNSAVSNISTYGSRLRSTIVDARDMCLRYHLDHDWMPRGVSLTIPAADSSPDPAISSRT
jgi:hypothetical protein